MIESSLEQTLRQALSCHKAGAMKAALELYLKVLESDPNQVDAHHNLGMLAMQLQRHESAIYHFQQALTLKPEFEIANSHLGILLHNMGQFSAAKTYLLKASTLNPNNIEYLTNLAFNLQSQGLAQEAEPYFRAALKINSEDAKLHAGLSTVLKLQDRLAEALLSCKQAIQIQPDSAKLYSQLGAIYFAQSLLIEAENAFIQAVKLDSDYAEAFNNLGSVQQFRRDYANAEQNYRTAIQLRPNYAQAHTNLGINLQTQGRLQEAESCWRKSLSLEPDQIETQSGLVFHLSYTADSSNTKYVDAARNYGCLVAKHAQPYSSWNCDQKPAVLKIGLVSGDFRNHPVAHFLHGLLSHVQAEQIQFIAYTTLSNTDEFSKILQPYFADWKNIAALNDAQAAQLIHQDGVHILIDLCGHSAYNRLALFAWKSAPIQISWLGFLASTGVESIDYVLSDPHSLHSTDEQYFIERIWRLPESCISFTPNSKQIAVNELPAISSNKITFASFNNLTKMGDDVVAIWSRVLHNIPNSTLVLKASQLNEAMLCSRTLHRFAQHQITADRIVLLGTLADHAQHMSTYHQIDIALDTFPYPGVTTSVEALWMGVPVLTLQGNGVLARAGESININAGLADWIAKDADEFVEKAIKFSANLEQLAALRAGLRLQLSSSILFDSKRFAKHFCQTMWDIWKHHKNQEN